MAIVFENNTYAQVTGGGTDAPASGTSENWTVSTATGFPSALGEDQFFHICDPAANTEKIRVTAISSNVWTVTRGDESTTPVAHVAGFVIEQVVTAGELTADFFQPDWVNVCSPAFGADPTNTNDSTSAIQSALNYLASNSLSRLYIPAGSYKISSTLLWTVASALHIQGDSNDSTYLRMNASTAVTTFHCLEIDNVPTATIENLSIITDSAPAAYTDDWAGLYFENSSRIHVNKVHVATGTSSQRVNIAVELDSCTTASIMQCDLRGYVNAVYMYGTTAGVDIISTQLYTNNGSGVTTAGNITMWGDCATLHVTNSITAGGDHGLVMGGGTGANPAFVFLNDFEINNCFGDGVSLQTGSEVWANQLWCSLQSVAYTAGAYSGINAGTAFYGWLNVDNSVFQHCPASGITINGNTASGATNSSYWISNTSFSGCGGHASDDYYDVYLAACSAVTIVGCHFDVDPYNTTVYANAGICVSGNVANTVIMGCQFAPSGYGTSAVIADGTTIETAANIAY